jgi:2-keto-4-pentenoate hydratase/2-oxohepta-3-ene-1,7-dioic acid hydratase in catechol pathway
MKVGTWLLISLEQPAEGRSVAAKLSDGRVVEVDCLPPGVSLLQVIQRWAEFNSRLNAWKPNGARELTHYKITAPLRFPAAVVCVGANYHGHRREVDAVARTPPSRPFIFLKPPVTTVIGDGDVVRIRSETDQIDWEAEIALVIGKPGRNIRRAEAMNHVAGYTLVNDVSARACLRIEGAIHPALEYDWLAMKGQDTFCPMGPGILPAWFIDDPSNIRLSLTVNGEVKQDGTTADMVLGMADLVAAASQFMSLSAGDVIATGTPAGVGSSWGHYLKHGDEMIVNCPLIGSLHNQVRRLDDREDS